MSAVLLLPSAICSGKPPPTLPLAFSQRFTMSDGSTGGVFYDYARRQQRIEHMQNTKSRLNQCYFWYNTTEPCTEYFTPDGEMWVDIPSEDFCCLESCASSACRENITYTPRPDFANTCDYNGMTRVDNISCDFWSCPGTFSYYVDSISSVPVKFATADQKFVLHYDVSSFNASAQLGELFVLPRRCKQRGLKCAMRHPLPPEAR